MAEASKSLGSVQFGPFELLLDTQELRKHGLPVKLSGQAIQILIVLATRPGQLVTREELQRKLWPTDSYGDFEHGLNAAINKLREKLGDSATTPTYVETLPGRGYRFIGTIETLPSEPPARSAAADKQPLAGASEPVSVSGIEVRQAKSKRWLWIVAIVALLAVFLTSASVLYVAFEIHSLYWQRVRSMLPGASQPIRSLAVLPLTNLSHDPEQEYFADGMTEALITELSQISSLKIISRTSAMHYKGSNKSLPEIGKELNVDGIIEGSVLRADGRVRVGTQLVNAASDTDLWAKSYERDLRDILKLQGEIARAIADEVKANVSPDVKARLTNAHPLDPRAYEAYLKGLYYVNRWPEPESVHCIESFQRAIEIEPTFADAQAGLATCYTVMPWTYPPKEVYPRAKAAATEALRLDANQAEAYAALGAVNMFFEWDWGSAEQNLRRALELNPNRAFSRASYSNYFMFLGRSQEAIREAKAAVQLDPASIITNRNLAFVYLLSHKYPEYAAQTQATLELTPSDETAQWDLALAFALQGKRNEARKQLTAEVVPIDRAVVLAILGDKELALQALKEAGPPSSPITAKYANAYAPLGERDTAIRLLEQAYEERDAEMVQLYTHPALDSLRSDPRFQALLRRMNFPSK